jgi:hypothetical protein
MSVQARCTAPAENDETLLERAIGFPAPLTFCKDLLTAVDADRDIDFLRRYL